MTFSFEALRPKLFDLFDHLHAHPELSWRETQTTDYVRQFLEARGCRVRLFDDCPGLIAEIGEGRPVVGFRADMDALWQEVDGSYRANHSCGHDAHMTVAAGALMALQKARLPPGTIRFIFQPAEEKGTGALALLGKEAVDDLSFLFGLHLRPERELPDGEAAAAIQHGAARIFSGRIEGRTAHGAWPHLGVNAVEVGAALVQALQAIHTAPQVPASVKMTRFLAGGESANVIPGSAEFALDLRAQTNDAMDDLLEKVRHAVEGVAALQRAGIELHQESWIVAAEIHPEAQRLMHESIMAVLGEENAHDRVVTPGGEDFHFYAYKRPQLKTTMLGLGCGLTPGLHHPNMTFNREAILSGAAIAADVLIRALRAAGAAT